MDLEKLRRIEGLQTVETVAGELGVSRQSAINLLSRLKRRGHVTVQGGGRQIRLYRITMRKQRPRDAGMFDLINKHSPLKVQPWYDHQVHGEYHAEEAIVDAIETRSFRVILASLRLFNHVKNWKRLYALAKERDVWQQVGALYDLSRESVVVRKMPGRYLPFKLTKWKALTQLRKRTNYPGIQKKWRVYIPFNKSDMAEIRT